MAAGPNLPWLTGTGAVPVQGSLDNVYNGLQMGVFDGMIRLSLLWGLSTQAGEESS